MLPEMPAELKEAQAEKNCGIALFGEAEEHRLDQVLLRRAARRTGAAHNFMDKLPSLEGGEPAK